MTDVSPLHERLQAVIGRRTYKAIGDMTETHPETVRRYMQGQSPSVEFIAAVCARLGINSEWLLTGMGPTHAADVRAHAIGQASAAELLKAMAATLERLTERVERLEVFTQTLELRLRATADRPGGKGAGGVEVGVPNKRAKARARPATGNHNGEHGSGTDGSNTGSDNSARRRADAVADALPRRSR